MNLADCLIVIDMQNGVLTDGTHEIWQRQALIDKVKARIAQYRQLKLPIIFVQHEDEELVAESLAWQLVPDLPVLPEDFLVRKTHANSFYRTNLQKILSSLPSAPNVDSSKALKHQGEVAALTAHKLEFCGAQTEFCVNASLVFAHGLGYENVMLPGYSSTYANEFLSAEDLIAFYERLWDGRFVNFISQ